MLRIKLVRSMIGQNASNKKTVRSIGLRKMHQVVEHPDTPSVRGMIHKVKHMLLVETVEDAPAKKEAKPKKEETPVAVVEETKPKPKKTTKKSEEGN